MEGRGEGRITHQKGEKLDLVCNCLCIVTKNSEDRDPGRFFENSERAMA